nr:potassium-transporting ATPase subunit F [Pantoea sp. IMH]
MSLGLLSGLALVCLLLGYLFYALFRVEAF